MEYLLITVGAFEVNCAVLWTHGLPEAWVIDPGEDADMILEALRQRELTLSRIILTHGHIDHIYQADAWRVLSGAPLAIHAADRACLTDPGRNLSAVISSARTFAPAEAALVDGQTIELDAAHRLTVWHTPGHTAGSCCFLLEEEGKPTALFSGDTLFAGSVGRTDLGGEASALDHSLRFLAGQAERLGLDETHDLAVYPGHGPATGLAREVGSNPFFP